ncbi:MAG: hypothetical protein GY903_06705 [Fuerstiella sp.]|nr:hypothetical protein [Fuerstiella sp.]
MSTIQPGVNSTVSLTVGSNEHVFAAAVSVDAAEEQERIDVTGFGDSVRSYEYGVKAATEITIRTYADPGNLTVGTALTATDISIGGATGGRSFSGAATVVSYSSSADVDGATTYEIGILY